MISSPSGTNLTSLLGALKPAFYWDAFRADRGLGNGLAGGLINFDITDADAVTPADPFMVWDDGNDCFKLVDAATYPEQAIGAVGDFADGKVSNYWFTDWSTANLGFAVTAPTTSAVLSQVASTPPDILSGGSFSDVTFVDTDEAQDSIIEKSNSKSSSYTRVFQILVKSVEGYAPNTYVEVGMNAAAGTRTTDGANTLFRELPGARGWYAVLYVLAAGSPTTNYITMNFAQGSGRWYVAAPMFYNAYSTFENIVRAPIPRDSSTRERGQYYVSTADDEFNIPVTGWLAGSFVLPDPGVASGHLDYAGTGNYGFCALMDWTCGTYRIRLMMSTTYDHIVLQMDNGGTSFAYLDFPDDWSSFKTFGFCVSWGISNGSEYANLYVNGIKEDSVFGATDWFPHTSTPSKLYIGSDGTASADCWISRIALGRQPLHRAQARMLSTKMLELARGGA